MNGQILIDGDYLEGGGQIVRTSLALSTILKKPFTVNNIRKGRLNQGLKNQHLFCVEALKQLCNANAIGVELGSTYLEYIPGDLVSRNLNIDIGTAGSVTLLLQAILLPCIFTNKKTRIKIHGGTDTKWAMPFDYFKEILLPQIKRYCLDISANLIKRGYYPAGNGYIEVIITPKYNLTKFNSHEEFITKLRKDTQKINLLEQGSLIQIKGVSHASKSLESSEVAERQASSAKNSLSKFNCKKDIRIEYSQTESVGSGITLWAVFSKDNYEINYSNPVIIGSDELGEKGKKAEIVGAIAGKKLGISIMSNAPVDSHLADNLIPYIGLFGGSIKTTEITNHTLTNIYVVESFLGKRFKISQESNIIEAGD